MFQSSLQGFNSLYSVSRKFIQLGTLLPAVGFIVYGTYHIRRANKTASDKDHTPLSPKVAAFLYSAKILVPIVIYTLVNFKLPAYVPYEAMSKKACEVTVSLAFFPPGRDGPILNETYSTLRSAYTSFFSNDANLVYPQFKKFEKSLVNLPDGHKEKIMDDSKGLCVTVGADTLGPLKVLNKYFDPVNGIEDFCHEGVRAARTELKLSYAAQLEFPLKVLLQQFSNLFSAVPITYFGCSRSLDDNMVAVNTSESFKELCTAFYSSKSYSHLALKYHSFASLDQHKRYAATIALLPTESQRQVACMIVASLKDPKTGYDAAAGFFCPPLLSYLKEQGDQGGVDINPLNWTIEALRYNPIAKAPKGFADLGVAQWETFLNLVTDTVYAMHTANATVVTNEGLSHITRWTLADPRSLAQESANVVRDDLQALVQETVTNYQKVRDYLSSPHNVSSHNLTEQFMAIANNFQYDFERPMLEKMTAMYEDVTISSTVSMFKMSQLFSTKVIEASTAAIHALRYAMGTYIGFGVVFSLVPFALAIVFGIAKGVNQFTIMHEQSGAFQNSRDKKSLVRFCAVLQFIAGIIVAVPNIAIVIFFYQAFADQFFILVVLGAEVYVINNMAKGFYERTWVKTAVLAVAGLLGMLGIVLWIIFDEYEMFKSWYLSTDTSLSFMQCVTILFGTAFNFYFSKIVTLILVSKMVAWVFALDGVSNTTLAYVSKSGEIIKSDLYILDVYSKKVKELSAEGGERVDSTKSNSKTGPKLFAGSAYVKPIAKGTLQALGGPDMTAM